MTRTFPTLLAALALAGCASTKPVLYPNPHYKTVGEAAAQRDVDACMEQAKTAGAASGNARSKQIARNTAGSAAVGAASGAVGGAIVGSAASGSAVGAASSVTAGLIRLAFSPAERNPTFENYVNQCLTEKGYQPMGWN